jgi:hypothetical protein
VGLTFCTAFQYLNQVLNSVLRTIIKLLKSCPANLNSTNQLSSFAGEIVNSIIIPNATWRAGRKLAPLRGQAMEILLLILTVPSTASLDGSATVGTFSATDLVGFLKEGGNFLPVLVGCFDEDDAFTRSTAMKVMGTLLEGIVSANISFHGMRPFIERQIMVGTNSSC